ncbi:MAG TPA: serine/threonine-protein kinase [Candidatus Hydrogenedens sp.]|nr:serine/threonine-protein kinase [Candidatus Hydrogenedens sp.]
MDRRDEEKTEDTIIDNSQNPKKIGKYEIRREIGRGSMGVVYEGYDTIINRKVAIKIIKKDLSVSESVADEIFIRFKREAIMAGQINHTNVVTIYDMDTEGDLTYIVMEYIEGGDLKSLMFPKKKWDLDEVLKIANATCSALKATHEKKIVHRDIKPSNILITKEESIKLTDFGIARLPGSTLTGDETMIGTPHYMSPEQFEKGEVDERSDEFSLAVVLYELLTGEKPFEGDSIPLIMNKVLYTHPLPPSKYNIRLPKELDNVIMKAMSKNPDDRYPSIDDFAKALNDCIKKKEQEKNKSESEYESPTIIEHETAEKRTVNKKWTPTQQIIAIVGAVLIIGIVILGLFSSYQTSRESDNRQSNVPKTSNPYFGKAIFNIWQASTLEAYEDFQNYLDLKKISEYISPFEKTVELEIKDQFGEVVYENNQYRTGEAVQLEGEPDSISWVIKNGEDIVSGELPPTLKPKNQGETIAKHILLPPPKN